MTLTDECLDIMGCSPDCSTREEERVLMERIGRNVARAIEALLPADHDCPYPLVGAVNVPLPFEEAA